MRTWLVTMTLAAMALSGCTGSDPAPDEGMTQDPEDLLASLPVYLMFEGYTEEVREEMFTVTVSPQDNCIPFSCPVESVTASGNPAFLKVIDISSLLPQGMAAYVEMEATWSNQNPMAGSIGTNNLQWFSNDAWVTWCPQFISDVDRSLLECYATNHGPAPMNIIFVVIEPAQAGPYQVDVRVTVRPILDQVQSFNSVAVDLVGGEIPIRIGLPSGATQELTVRGPDKEEVLRQAVADGDTVALPEDSRRGTYILSMTGDQALATYSVSPDHLVGQAIMTPVDTTVEAGTARAPPPQGPMQWTVNVDEPPAMMGIAFNSLDGRSTILNAEVTVTGPDGSTVISGTFNCQICLFSLSTWTTGFERPELTAGTYTYNVEVIQAQGFTLTDLTYPFAT